MTTTRLYRSLALFAVIGLTVASLAGCVGSSPMPLPTTMPTSSPSATATPTPTAEPAAQLRPGGSAAANKQFFDAVNKAFNAAHGMSDGRSIIDNLVANGFVRGDMEVTYDTTALDIPVDLIVFSVKIQGECLIGQFDATGYTSIKGPMLGTGMCLVGTTRPIDW